MFKRVSESEIHCFIVDEVVQMLILRISQIIMNGVFTGSIQFKNVYIFLFFISGLITNAIAQEDIKLPELVPPSPNASSLGVYGEIPVDKSTGVPNITIPLYTISVDDISVPISLSFHASGHKVGSRASWVGLGWSLNAGGVVTRSMRGKPDESGYFYNMADVKSWEDNDLLPVVHKTIPSTSDQAIIDLKNSMWDFYSQNHDVQADLFYYNFLGGAGKFSFNYDQTIIDFPYKDLSISPTNLTISIGNGTGEISGFEIIDQQGIKYLFDEEEETIVDYPSDYLHLDTERYTSSWYLTSILSQRSSKEVNFTYSDYIILADDVIQNSIYMEVKPETGPATLNIQNSVSTTSVLAKYLEEISWEGGKIIFHKSGDRQDLPSGGQQLDYIEIFDSYGSLIQSIHFGYEHFNRGTSALNMNLKLMSVEEHATSGQVNPPHVFEYYSGVPARDSKAMDHFGYYNGQDNNSTLVPPFWNFSGVNYNTGTIRDVGNATSVCGMIKTIQYPTGGTTEFLYEANDYLSNSADVPISQLTQGSVETHVEKCDANGLLYTDQSGMDIIGLICLDSETASIIIPANARQTLLSISIASDLANPPAIGVDDVFYVKVYSVEQSTETLVYYYNSIEDFSLQDFLLAGTEYRIESSTDIIGTGILARITYWHDDSSNPVFSNIITGGIRIASIKQYDDINVNPVKVTNYNYTLQDDPMMSSGILLSAPPNYSKGIYSAYIGGNSGYEGETYSIHYANPIGLLGSMNGSHIIYGEVFELEEGNGWSRSTYSTDRDELTLMPYEVPGSAEKVSAFWKRGLPLETQIFTESGSLIRSSENYYTNIVKDSSLSFVFEPHNIAGNAYPLYNQFKFAINRQVSGWARLDSTIERDFAAGVELFKTIEYSYSTAIPSELGLVLPIQVAYDFNNDLNYSITTNYLNDRDKHIISPVVNNSTFNHVDELRYSIDNIYSSYKLNEKQMKNNDGELIRKVNYGNYNGLKPSEIIDSNGTTISYIWGYDETLPVAKIINATRAAIEALHGFGTGFIAGAGSLSQAQEDALRSSLPNAMVTSFTYKPLVGILSQTDPNGLVTKFYYDDFNRLEYIEDNDGNVTSKVEYHFKQ